MGDEHTSPLTYGEIMRIGVIPAVVHDEDHDRCDAWWEGHRCLRIMGHLTDHEYGLPAETPWSEDEGVTTEAPPLFVHPASCRCDGRGVIPGPDHHAVPCPDDWSGAPPPITMPDDEKRCAACGHTEEAHRWGSLKMRRTCTCGCPEYVVRPELPPTPVPIAPIIHIPIEEKKP